MAKRNETVLQGFHAIFEALRAGSIRDGDLYLSTRNAKARDLAALAKERGLNVHQVDRDELTRWGGAEARHAVLVSAGPVTQAPANLEEFLASAAASADDALVLVLDHIEDPHNLGAILRSADQFGVDLVVAPSRRSAPTSQVVASASAGAASYVPLLREANLPRVISRLRNEGFWVFGADAQGPVAPALDFAGRVALVMGSEGRGLSRLVTERCDQLVSIPTEGHVDSLNVSVAAGILLFEVRRQQRFSAV